MLTPSSDVLSPVSDDIPEGIINQVFTPSGATTTTENPSPSVEFTLNAVEPPRVTSVKGSVLTNAQRVEVILLQPNGDQVTKVPI